MNRLFVSFVLLAACGGDPLEPGAGDNRGSGTNSLRVDGSVHARPNTPNANTHTAFTTEFEVHVSLGDVRIDTGTVRITTQFDSIDLAWRDNGGQFGTWAGTIADYVEVYQLDVISGADNVQGVIVDGPDIAVFTAPTAGGTMDSTIANTITWSREDVADTVTFRAENIDRITIEDTGTYSMSPGALKANKNEPTENTIELTRTRRTTPAGAVGESSFSVTIDQEIDVLAAPNPAL